MLIQAIKCYEDQNYPNKELVVCFPKNDKATKEILVSHLHPDGKYIQIERPDDESLGNARNRAIMKCTGSYICMWDDDDWYHSSRLSFQFNSMQIVGERFQGSVLSRILLYDATKEEAYYSFSYTWDGTIMCRKELLLQNQYANRNAGEDTHVITFLSARKLLHKIEDAPFLYVYIYHGENTWGYDHFQHFLTKSHKLDNHTTAALIATLS